MAGKKATTKAKYKSEEKKPKPPARLPTLKTLGNILTSKSSQSEDAHDEIIDLINIREFLIQKTVYYKILSSSLHNLELKATGKIFSLPSPVDEEKRIVTEDEVQLIPSDEQARKKRLAIKLTGISELLSAFNLSSNNSFEVVWLCCIHMHSSYFILQSISTISSHSFYILTSLDQAIMGCAFQLLGYFHGKQLISGQDLKKFHIFRTSKSTIAKRRKHENHKEHVKLSAIKISNQFKLSTVKNNISEAAFVNMIKDDLSPLKMSERKIKTLLHELQNEGQIKFDPRKAKSGKM